MYSPPQINQSNNANLAVDMFKNKNNGFMQNNPAGMNINQPNMGIQGRLPNVNELNQNFNLNGNTANNLLNNLPNMGFMNSNNLQNNFGFGQQQLKATQNINLINGQNQNQYAFKQKDQTGQVIQQQTGPQVTFNHSNLICILDGQLCPSNERNNADEKPNGANDADNEAKG
jgi:hypothetical protein